MEADISALAPTERKRRKRGKSGSHLSSVGLWSAREQANGLGFCAEFRGFPSELVKENNSEELMAVDPVEGEPVSGSIPCCQGNL